MEKDFNIIITGVGGQGLITLLRILAEAAFLQGFDVRTSELHGLSQREGSVQAHVRFGKQIFSPLIGREKADLILGLEACEVFRVVDFLGKKTTLLINKKFIPYLKGPSEKEVFEKINRIPGKIHLVDASKICQEKFGQEVLATVFLLGSAISKKLLPLKSAFILKGIKKIVPKEFFDANKKAFQLGQKYD